MHALSAARLIIVNQMHIILMCSGITCGRMLNGELYAQNFQKLIYRHVFTDYFMKISPPASE